MKLKPKPAFGQDINQEAPVDRSDVIHLFDGQLLDADPTTVNSYQNGPFAALGPGGVNPLPSGGWDEFDLILQIDSANTPTSIEFFIEYSPDGGTTWFHYAQNLFASLIYDDTVVASGLNQIFRGQVAGEAMRLRVVALGTDGTDTFTFSASIQFARK